MHRYDFLKKIAPYEPTEEARRSFLLQRAAQADHAAEEWAGRDEVQVDRWKAEATRLRAEWEAW